MSWNDVRKLAKQWMDAERTELLSTHVRHDVAEGRRIEAERQLKQAAYDEASYQVAEQVLPPKLAAAVTAARPENVAARREEARLERLRDLPTASLELTAGGTLEGSVRAELPLDGPDIDVPDGRFALEVTAVEPVPMGGHTFYSLSLLVPNYQGPGHYDLIDLSRRAEAGEVDEWDLLDIGLQLGKDCTDEDCYWYAGSGVGTIDVGDGVLTFDLGMASAVGDTRVTGRVGWA